MCHCLAALKFSSVTNHVGLREADGHIVGFADFNADKTTDILLRSGVVPPSSYPSPYPLPSHSVVKVKVTSVGTTRPISGIETRRGSIPITSISSMSH